MTPEFETTWFTMAGSIAVALGLGLMVGLEREQFQSRVEDRKFGGIRTFSLLGLLGAIGGVLYTTLGWAAPILIGGLVGVFLIGSALMSFGDGTGKGVTTEVAGLVVHFLGLLAACPLPGVDHVHRWGVAAAAGIATMSLLSLRNPLHTLAEKVSSEDLYATSKLGVLLLIMMPLLPNEQIGPIPHFNPFEVGLLVTLIAAIGFVGYISVRFLGSSRGMTLTGLVGGLASSTAVTLNFAGRVREQKELAPVAALGIVLASTIMFPRQLLEVAVVDHSLVQSAAGPLLAMGGTGAIMTGIFYWLHGRTSHEEVDVNVRNPFSLDQAIKFGALYVAILVISNLALDYFGSAGVYVSAVLAGVTDVDAITLTISRLHKDGLDTTVATIALIIAAASNTAAKGVITLSLGGRQVGYRVLGIFIPMMLVGGLAAYWQIFLA